MNDIFWKIKSFFWRVKNTWSWAKFIWKIRWHEYDAVYEIMKFSLLKTIHAFENARVHHVGMEHDIYYMRLCVKLIERIQSEYYDERAFDELEKRWGKYNTTIKPIDGDDAFYSMIIKRELEKTEEDSARYKEDFVRTHKYWTNKHEKAKKLLYRILQERLEHWWI